MAHFNRPTSVCDPPPSEFLGRRQEGDAAGEEPDRGPEEPDEANPEGGQPALGEEGVILGVIGGGGSGFRIGVNGAMRQILCLERDEQDCCWFHSSADMLQNAT